MLLHDISVVMYILYIYMLGFFQFRVGAADHALSKVALDTTVG
jgi:hypothetical protein